MDHAQRDAEADSRGPISRYVPAAIWLGSTTRQTLSSDLVAGVTAAAVVIPQALAYATLAGLPVQHGLYVSFVPMLAYAFVGTSRVLSVSTILAVDASASPDWEVTALSALEQLDADLRARGIELWLCSLTPRPLEMLRRSDLADRFEDRLFPTLDAARTAYQSSRT